MRDLRSDLPGTSVIQKSYLLSGLPICPCCESRKGSQTPLE